MGSLRRRTLINAVAAAALSVAVVSIALFTYIDAVTLKRFDRALDDRHTQLVVALSENAQNPAALEKRLIDPAYQRPYSGRYWQVMAPDGTVYTSPSLFGATLVAPMPSTDRLESWTGPSPNGGQLRGMQQRITLGNGSVWTVTAAETLTPLLTERYETRKSLLIAFGIVAAFGLLSAWLQVTVVLRPLSRLREEVATRWDRDARLDPHDYPSEVAPLVSDIDVLLARNKETVARARRQASDLAHALKTPAAIVRNELMTLQEQGRDVGPALEALGRLDAHLRRSLARMNAIQSAKGGAGGPINATPTLDRLSRLFGAMCARHGKKLEVTNAPDLQVWMDRQDLEEVLGNLLDNALKWGRTTVRLSAISEPSGVALCVEDDGVGIPEAERARVLESGARLDLSVSGTGLGLAIVSDLVSAYGGRLELSTSVQLGGLFAAVHLPHHAGLLGG
jgi:signal transduction histidine kinase